MTDDEKCARMATEIVCFVREHYERGTLEQWLNRPDAGDGIKGMFIMHALDLQCEIDRLKAEVYRRGGHEKGPNEAW